MCIRDRSIEATTDMAYSDTISTIHRRRNITSWISSALVHMKNHKATDLDGINIALLKCGGRILDLRTLHLLKKCWKQKDGTIEISRSYIIIQKVSPNSCKNYRGISCWTHPRMCDCMLGCVWQKLLGEQSGFRKGRSWNDNITIVLSLIHI